MDFRGRIESKNHWIKVTSQIATLEDPTGWTLWKHMRGCKLFQRHDEALPSAPLWVGGSAFAPSPAIAQKARQNALKG